MKLTILCFVICLVVFCSQVYEGHYLTALFDFILLICLLDNICLRAVIERQSKDIEQHQEMVSKMTDKEFWEIHDRKKNLNGTA